MTSYLSRDLQLDDDDDFRFEFVDGNVLVVDHILFEPLVGRIEVQEHLFSNHRSMKYNFIIYENASWGLKYHLGNYLGLFFTLFHSLKSFVMKLLAKVDMIIKLSFRNISSKLNLTYHIFRLADVVAAVFPVEVVDI